MRISPIMLMFFVLFQGCFTTTRNPNQSTYYDGFRESESVESEGDRTEAANEAAYDRVTENQNYYYDPYYMNRYMVTRFDYAWYWRSMYRPYRHRHHRNFSIYFGYTSGPIWNSYNDYYSYDPYYDYYWDDYYYWHDYYSPYHNYYGSIYRPYSYYPRNVVYVTDRSSVSSNQRRGYSRLTQKSGGISQPNPKPVQYYTPYIAIIPPTTKSNPDIRKVRVNKVQKPRVLKSDHKERRNSKVTKPRAVKKPRKETVKSTRKKSSASSVKNSRRREVARPSPKSETNRKSKSSKSKSKKSDD